MTQPRTSYVDVETTPYYHLVSRCVRRPFLCGVDPHTGRDYSHRRAWMVERLRTLGEVFAVEICAYAVMSNHFHLVIRVEAEAAAAWSDEQVLERYEKLFTESLSNIQDTHIIDTQADPTHHPPMTQPRTSYVDVETTPYYHLVLLD